MPNKEYGPQNRKYPAKALGRKINVHKGSELPGKMSAIKTDLKRVPSKSVGSPKSSGIQSPSIKITSSGGGQFVRPASKKRSMAPMGDPIKSVQTTAKDKPINYNLVESSKKDFKKFIGEKEMGTSETPHKGTPPTSFEEKAPQKDTKKGKPTKSKNNYGG